VRLRLGGSLDPAILARRDRIVLRRFYNSVEVGNEMIPRICLIKRYQYHEDPKTDFIVHADSDNFSVVCIPVNRKGSIPVAKLCSRYCNLRVTGWTPPVQASAALELALRKLSTRAATSERAMIWKAGPDRVVSNLGRMAGTMENLDLLEIPGRPPYSKQMVLFMDSLSIDVAQGLRDRILKL
jgi:hypothetical protein